MFGELESWIDPQRVSEALLLFIPRLVSALVVFLLFWLAVRLTLRPIRAVLRRARFEDALIHLLVDNVYRLSLLTLGGVMAASQLGINVGAALAGIGVVGIAFGFAAQDSVANTISGFLIFWDKPFRVGQYIESEGHYGEVVEITMRTTRIRTRDNTYAIIPNKEVIQGVLVNHSMYGESRVVVPVGIAYKEDVAEARRVLLSAVSGLDGVLREPVPDVVVAGLGSSSVDLHVRVWVDRARHEKPVFFRTLEASKTALDEAGIQIPFPHLQLRVDGSPTTFGRGSSPRGSPATSCGAPYTDCMKASDLFIRALELQGVESIFGVPGEENLDLIDSLRGSSIRLIVTRHEQHAAFMAATHGRLTGRAGVCLSTLGPGATNLMTGLAYAQLGGMPLVAITGQKALRGNRRERFSSSTSSARSGR